MGRRNPALFFYKIKLTIMAIFKTFKVSNKDAFLLTKAVQTTLLNEQKKKVYPKNFPEQQKIIEDLKNLFNELCKQHSEQIEI